MKLLYIFSTVYITGEGVVVVVMEGLFHNWGKGGGGSCYAEGTGIET